MKIRGLYCTFSALVLVYGVSAQAELEEVRVWGEQPGSREQSYAGSSFSLSPVDFDAINATTTEDLVKYAPSLAIRRRFIGDANGTLGIRGANMFQTARSMVFADGVPLHYFLQSRWNGAPRWTLVSASEIAKVDVVYGPFSAEYSGNAMGGVVVIETAIPTEFELNADASVFAQDFSAYGFDDTLTGKKGFVSLANAWGDISAYLSINHLDTQAAPQTFRGGSTTQSEDSDTVSGAIFGLNSRLDGDGNPTELAFFGDTGVVDSTTDNLKFKLGYSGERWQTLLNIAYEDRDSTQEAANPYVRDAEGNIIYSGGGFIQEGREFSVNSTRLNASRLDRESLSAGLRLRADIGPGNMEINISEFAILRDDRFRSSRHLDDPTFDGSAQLTEFDDSGWQTADIKYSLNELANGALDIKVGARFEAYELNLNVDNVPQYRGEAAGTPRSRFGGKTQISAAFVQSQIALSDRWSLGLGLRVEEFEASGGYFSEAGDTPDTLNIVSIPRESRSDVSPKFSLNFEPNDRLTFRYALAKAFRYPIVEELFRQYQAFNVINESNPDLAPEEGIHHNFMSELSIPDGFVRVNFFLDDIDNAIESQTTTIVGGPNDGVSVGTFVPLDETRTRGVELIWQQRGIWDDRVDLQFNTTFLRATIERNAANPQWEGNTYPRMPKWRANLLGTYHANSRLALSVSAQYASDAFGRIGNDDTIDEVYGAIDAYQFWGLKARYEFSDTIRASLGIDNLFDQLRYVAHPWPRRTAYLGVEVNL